jgi:CheY-like chemotaxis protein
MRILVVDDDAAVGRLTVGMLEGSGHHAVAATDPETALQWLFDGERFDLVLTDVLMPGGMSGIDFGREIRRRWAKLPVLLATGYAGDEGFARSEFAVLRKPFTAIELTHAIKALIQHQTLT